MNTEVDSELVRRAAVHAALGEPARLRIVDTLRTGDASPSELAGMLAMPSNLLAHHLKTLEAAGVVTRHRSEGDGRRTYLTLAASPDDPAATVVGSPPGRVVFVCTANSARSHLAAALWRRASAVPTASAGTHPADRIAPGALAAAARHDLDLPEVAPRHLDEVSAAGDLVVTVCDRAHEELGTSGDVHWSVPDPVRPGTARAFDAAYDDLARRVGELTRRVSPTA
ncbi:helix-turn-helix domain-containing protein [Nocardioides panacisoli]|uniref:arsenate reductase/protein-tyrosine-phosphatase family protein n=1 Tax=Nocardioides panacisoli TaxID=627624 RepID=UPI001C62B89D|nr:ArsR family transcriptional regulator [Nocardioides panacisoli]QYJ05707.1 helix-turn-helix domain-containing protein [Nocardioides panacisoli]